MGSRPSNDRRRYESARLRPSPRVALSRRRGVDHTWISRRKRCLGNSLALLLRIHKRSDESSYLEGKRHYPRTIMAPTRRLDIFAFIAFDWRIRGLHSNPEAIRTTPQSYRWRRARRPNSRHLHRPRSRSPPHPRPRLLNIPRTPNPRPDPRHPSPTVAIISSITLTAAPILILRKNLRSIPRHRR